MHISTVLLLIVEQERSSAKRKELFKEIQSSKDIKVPHQLLLDSPTRWSSTYVMLDLAERLHEVRFRLRRFGNANIFSYHLVSM